MSDMQKNALSVYAELSGYGFSLNAIAGILGNMQTESTINPGIWQNLTVGTGGYGLTQWTPYTKYSNWAGSGWENNGDKECERINYEFEHQGIQYIPTSKYPLSAAEFKTSDLSPQYLAYAFLYNYERPTNKNQPKRRTQADYWYTFLSGEEPPSGEDDPEEELFPVWLLFKIRERNFIKCQ